MDLQQLRCFAMVCKYQSFTKAADKMFISQSSISKNITALEKELGVSLLNRNKQYVLPTAAGAFFFSKVQSLLQSLDVTTAQTKKIGHGIEGFLKIGVNDQLDINGILPNFLRYFSLNEPSIDLDFCMHSYKDLPDMILTGAIDVAFVPNTGNDVSPSFKSIAINRDFPRLYFSCDHPKAGKKELNISDFKDDTFLLLDSPNSHLLNIVDEIGCSFRNTKKIKSLNVMKLYLEANLGVTILGASQSFFYSSRVKTIPISGLTKKVGTDLIALKNSPNTSVDIFFKYIEKHLSKTASRHQ